MNEIIYICKIEKVLLNMIQNVYKINFDKFNHLKIKLCGKKSTAKK
jgi:hypothetical protein